MAISIDRRKLIEAPVYKSLSLLDVNCDEAKVKLAIWEAQQLYILPLLSSALFNKVLNDVAAGSLAGYYETLYNNHIVNTLVYYTNYIVAPHLKFNWASRGIEVKQGENSNAVDDEQLHKLRYEEKNKAEMFAKQLNNYIDANLSQFPELNQNTTIDKLNRNNHSYSTSMFLENGEGEKNYFG